MLHHERHSYLMYSQVEILRLYFPECALCNALASAIGKWWANVVRVDLLTVDPVPGVRSERLRTHRISEVNCEKV